MRRLLLVLPLLVVAAWQGQRTVAVWTSDLTLWRHAVEMQPPGTPRAAHNYRQARFLAERIW